MSNSKQFFKNTSIYVIGEVVPRLLSFITFPILTVYLTPSDYGINSYVSSITSLLFILSNLSLSTYFFVHYFRSESEEEKKVLTSTLAIFTTVYSFGLIIAFCSIGPTLLRLWGGNVDFYPYIFLGTVGMFFEVIVIYPSAIYRVIEKPTTLISFNISKSITNVIGILYVVYIQKGALKDIILMQTLISGIFGICFVFYSRKFYYFIFEKEILVKALKFSLPLVPASLSWYAFNTFDRVLIDKYLTLNDLGLFSTAATLALMLNIVTNSAYKAFEPLFFKHFGKDDFIGIYTNIKNMYIYLTLVGALFLSLFSKEFFIIFSSKEFLLAHKFVPYILIGTVASSISLLYSTIITAMGKTKHNALITIFGALCSILVNILLLKVIGIWAAILASALTYILSLLIRIYFSKRQFFESKSVMAFLIAFFPAILFNSLEFNLSFNIELLIKAIISIGITILLTLFMNIKIKKIISLFSKNTKTI